MIIAQVCLRLATIKGHSVDNPSSCTSSTLTGHVTHWACLGCSGLAYTTKYFTSCQYPGTSLSRWRGVDQHSTGHSKQSVWASVEINIHILDCSAHVFEQSYCKSVWSLMERNIHTMVVYSPRFSVFEHSSLHFMFHHIPDNKKSY